MKWCVLSCLLVATVALLKGSGNTNHIEHHRRSKTNPKHRKQNTVTPMHRPLHSPHSTHSSHLNKKRVNAVKTSATVIQKDKPSGSAIETKTSLEEPPPTGSFFERKISLSFLSFLLIAFGICISGVIFGCNARRILNRSSPVDESWHDV